MKSVLRECSAIAILIASVSLTGCGDDEMMSDAAPDGGGDATPDGSPDGMTDAAPMAPTITRIEIIENPNNGLSATIEVETDIPTTAVASINSPTMRDLPFTSPLGTSHQIPVLGMRAEQEYGFLVTVESEDMLTAEDDTLTYSSPALPDDFPPLTTTVGDSTMVSPGVTVFNVFRWTPTVDPAYGYLIGIDEEGEVVWYYRTDHRIEDMRRLSNGNLVYVRPEDAYLEIDMMGNVVNTVLAEDVPTDSFHHELYELSGGGFVVLSTELMTIGGYEDGTVSYDVVGDVVVELDASGAFVNSASLFDVLDPHRMRLGFDSPFWNQRYESVSSGTKDWTHSNAVIYDERDDTFIVSVRHQDWLVKLRRDTGEMVWKFGYEGDFSIVGTGDYMFHMHGPELEADGNLLMYDNGNGREGLSAGEFFTRVVEFELDETSMTAMQVWEYRGTSDYSSPFVGDADRLENGNVLITDGGLVADPAAPVGAPDNQKSARVVEVTHEEMPQVVWSAEVHDDATTDPVGYTIYRSERLGSLYAE